LVVRLGPFAREAGGCRDDSPDRDEWALRRPKAWALALFACLVVTHELGRVPTKSIPLARFNQPTTSFGELTAELVRLEDIPVNEIHGLRVLARRALVFYLVVQGKFPIQIESSLEDLEKPRGSGYWILIDKSVARRSPRFPWPATTWFEVLDPITLLDTFPETVNRDSSAPPRSVKVELFAPRNP
jgi:hypothetical protein